MGDALILGASGPGVRAWQRIVGVKADGQFGPNTEDAVKVWQQARGVDPDGAIGDLTRAALQPGDLIKPYEGLRLQTYDDYDGVPVTLDSSKAWRRPNGALILGYPTIGWGRCLQPGEYIEKCTKAQADAWFDTMLNLTYMPAVRRTQVAPGAPQCAAASFAYNCGTGSLAKLAKASFAPEVWLSYNKTRGVVNAGLAERRAEELALFANP